MKRKVLRKEDGSWVIHEMKDLKPNDIFMLAEPDGSPEKHNLVWIALSDPIQDAEGTWGIECKDHYE